MRLHGLGFGFSLWRKKIGNVFFMLRKIGDKECMKRVVPYLIVVRKLTVSVFIFVIFSHKQKRKHIDR